MRQSHTKSHYASSCRSIIVNGGPPTAWSTFYDILGHRCVHPQKPFRDISVPANIARFCPLMSLDGTIITDFLVLGHIPLKQSKIGTREDTHSRQLEVNMDSSHNTIRHIPLKERKIGTREDTHSR